MKATAKAMMRRVRATLLVPDIAIITPDFHSHAPGHAHPYAHVPMALTREVDPWLEPLPNR
jgi:hypothetical protein